MIYTYAYQRPAVTVDIIVIKKDDIDKILLIKRENEPFKDSWALPGGFVDIEEELVESAFRELQEETGIFDIGLKQFCTYGKLGRDPRGRTISVVYFGYLTNLNQDIKANDDAKELAWFSLSKLPTLAFDHKDIISDFIGYKKSST